jgi:hypothetical protein
MEKVKPFKTVEERVTELEAREILCPFACSLH